MIVQTIEYENFLGIKRTEKHYFHITKASVLMTDDKAYNDIVNAGKELQERIPKLEKIQKTEESKPTNDTTDNFFNEDSMFIADTARMMARLLSMVVDISYGVLSEDGDRFVRDSESLAKFKSSMAYEKMLNEMMTSPDRLSNFITQLMES